MTSLHKTKKTISYSLYENQIYTPDISLYVLHHNVSEFYTIIKLNVGEILKLAFIVLNECWFLKFKRDFSEKFL